MNVREAAAHIVYQPIGETPDEAMAAALKTLLTANIQHPKILDLQDAARDVAHVGRQIVRHSANMAIAPEGHAPLTNRLERQMQAAQAKLTRAWLAVVPAEMGHA